jgi:glyoxylase-like metal-dependent hydrolase (beta-lactamase superfamily II)
VGQGRRGTIWAVAAVCASGAMGAPATARITPPPYPVFARSVVLAPAGGRVLVDTGGGPVPLTAARVVPVGTVVDTTA